MSIEVVYPNGSVPVSEEKAIRLAAEGKQIACDDAETRRRIIEEAGKLGGADYVVVGP